MLGASNHFGSTIAVLAQDEANPVLTKECFSDSPAAKESEAALSRAAIFKNFISYFGLEDEPNTGCRATRLDFEGTWDVESFWDTSCTEGSNRCIAIK